MVNDLGVDPDEWFDKLPPRPEEKMAENFIKAEVERVDPPAELLEVPTSVENPKPELEIKEETPHHIAYEIATSKYNPFSIGGSESIHDFGGGSENRLSENESRS